MDKNNVEKLRELIDKFLNNREDRSIALANEIEGLVIEHFSKMNFYDTLLLSLSLYRPGGGDHLDNEEALGWELQQARIELEHLY